MQYSTTLNKVEDTHSVKEVKQERKVDQKTDVWQRLFSSKSQTDIS